MLAGCCGNSNEEFDFKFNYWGESTTDEMNEGNNPKNISAIEDWWDNGEQGPKVNYAGWQGGSNDIGYTADIMLTDSNYNDIGNEYPALTDNIYVEVYDLDLIDSGSIEVEFSSDSDVDSETVTLTEVEAGLFRGLSC